jgi:hypothetical protein
MKTGQTYLERFCKHKVKSTLRLFHDASPSTAVTVADYVHDQDHLFIKCR